MKAPSFSRIALLLGVILGLMVVWASVAPEATSADMRIGGFVPGEGEGDCCSGTSTADCSDAGDPPGSMGCTGGVATICNNGSSGAGCCGDDSTTSCSGPGICPNVYDATCNSSNCS